MVAIQEEKNTSGSPALSSARWILCLRRSFGAKGFAVESAEALEPTSGRRWTSTAPPSQPSVDYRDNPLMGQLHLSQLLGVTTEGIYQ